MVVCDVVSARSYRSIMAKFEALPESVLCACWNHVVPASVRHNNRNYFATVDMSTLSDGSRIYRTHHIFRILRDGTTVRLYPF